MGKLLFFVVFICLSLSGFDFQKNNIRKQSGTVKSGFEMVPLRGGTYIMGGLDVNPSGQDADECGHSITLRDFSIGKYEVTQSDWTKVMGKNPSYFNDCNDCPVDQVSWNDVQLFIQKVNLKSAGRYRLPTEEEWEFAARGGMLSKNYKFSGSNNPVEVAWYSDNSEGKSHPVGLLRANELGIFDMSGNIWEWCENYKNPYPCDTTGENSDSKVLRGGTWSNNTGSVRVRDRNARWADLRLNTIGFRLAR
jgi:formylglycine-generating enzyme required for sulfatase activity